MDYSKLKNAELESLLKERSLPHGGKKAEMVARLTERDKTNGGPPVNLPVPPTNSKAKSPAPATSATGVSTQASSEPAAAAIAAGGTTRADNPTAVPNQKLDEEDPAKTNDLSVSKDTSTSASTALPSSATADPAATTDGAADAKNAPAAPLFTANLASTDVDTELEKRKARAKKFGITETDEEATKALERAKRFGTGTASEQNAGAAVKGLDQALPERSQRKRGRVAEGQGDAAKRQRGGRGDTPGSSRPRGPKREPSNTKAKENGGTNWMSEKDKKAAEARKARFAAST